MDSLTTTETASPTSGKVTTGGAATLTTTQATTWSEITDGGNNWVFINSVQYGVLGFWGFGVLGFWGFRASSTVKWSEKSQNIGLG